MANKIPHIDIRIIVNLLDGQEIICQEINDKAQVLLYNGTIAKLVAENINYICIQTTIDNHIETKTVYNKI